MQTFIPPWLKVGEQFRVIYKQLDSPIRNEVAKAIDYQSSIVKAESGFCWNFNPHMKRDWSYERIKQHGILKHKTQALVEKTIDRLRELTHKMTIARNAERHHCSLTGNKNHPILEEMKLTIDIMNEALEGLAQISQLNKRT